MKKSILSLLAFIFVISAYSQKKIWVPYRFNNQWGYSDTLGKIAVQPVYDSVFLFEDDFAFVFKGKYAGLINKTGKEIIKPGYDVIEFFLNGYKVTREGEKGYLQGNGKEAIPLQYDEIYSEDDELLILRKGNKLGLASLSGSVLVPVAYDAITSSFFAGDADPGENYLLYKGEAKFLFNKKTQKLSPFKGQVEEMKEAVAEISAIEIDEPDLSTVAGEVKQKLALDKASLFQVQGVYSSQVFCLAERNGKKGIVEYISPQEVKTIIPVEYDTVSYVISSSYNRFLVVNSEYLAAVSKDGKFGVVDEKGKIVIPFEYSGIGKLQGNSIAFQLEKEGKKGLFLPTTHYQVIQPLYDTIAYTEALPVSDTWAFALFKVIKNGKPGYVGENGIEFFK